MTFGAQILTAAGVVQFDSNDAAGGVCLGIYALSNAPSPLLFPDIIGMTGFVISTGIGGPVGFTSDNSLGYLRITLPTGYGPYNVAVFAK